MNFTNLANGGCTSVPCKQAAIITQDFDLLRILGINTAVAQNTGGGVIDAIPFDPERHPEASREKDPWFGVAVTGFAAPSTPSPLPYVFLDAIGGVGWAVPYAVAQKESLTLGFNIMNPTVLYRDFTTSPATDVPAAKRTILLSVVAHAPPGMELPKFNIGTKSADLDPGATVPGTIVVDKAEGGSNLPGWIDCLLKGNIWCWLILIIIITIIIIIFRRWRPSP
jgi:hypothetical protein